MALSKKSTLSLFLYIKIFISLAIYTFTKSLCLFSVLETKKYNERDFRDIVHQNLILNKVQKQELEKFLKR